MLAALALCGEVIDRDPSLSLLFLYVLGVGATGMLLARRRPILCLPFISLVLLAAFALYLKLSDSFKAILSEGGSGYILSWGFAILAGIAMPTLGASVGARKLEKGARVWRLTLGSSGTALLGLTVFFWYGFVRTAYNYYVVLPRIKAAHRYIMIMPPWRWQDIATDVASASVLFAFLLLSVHLLRSALRSEKPMNA
jgi:hypothetical protein